MRRVRRAAAMGAVAVALAAAAWTAWPYARSAAFLLDLAGTDGLTRALLPVRPSATTWRDLDVPTRDGPIPARLYWPVGAAAAGAVVVVPGVHPGGVDEPRLAAFSARLAAARYVVLSLPLPDLRAYRIAPRSTDEIEDAADWLVAQAALAPGGRVTIAGISFGGGLALVAAGRPSLAGRIDRVVSIGGYGDLPRTIRYLCTGRLPDGSTRPPSDYALAVLLLGALPDLVPPDQVAPLHGAIVTYLDGASALATDATAANTLLARARVQAAGLAEPARTVWRWVETRDAAALGARLLPFVDRLGGDPALSPDRAPITLAPVFLVHGADDDVIPPTEAPLLAGTLAAQGNHDVHWLVTPLLSHADILPSASLVDKWRLIAFWKQVLR